LQNNSDKVASQVQSSHYENSDRQLHSIDRRHSDAILIDDDEEEEDMFERAENGNDYEDIITNSEI